MRLAVNELKDLMAMMQDQSTKARKEERDRAKGILNQYRQELQIKVTALSNKVLETGMKDLAKQIHDITQETP